MALLQNSKEEEGKRIAALERARKEVWWLCACSLWPHSAALMCEDQVTELISKHEDMFLHTDRQQ
jgi:hypothetical protein